MSIEAVYQFDPFTRHFRSCLECRRIGRQSDIPTALCPTADAILDSILGPIAEQIEASSEFAALEIVMGDSDSAD